jgi:hypothetical protein
MYCSKSVTTRLITGSASGGLSPSSGSILTVTAEEALVFLPLDGAGAFDPLDQLLDVAIRQLQRLHDVGTHPSCR